VYVVVLVGQTSRLPSAATGPTPWLIETFVAPLVDQRSVEHLPRSMVDGSATKREIVGLGGAGFGCSTGLGFGGGGGGTGPLFLQPSANISNENATRLTLNARLLILNSCLLVLLKICLTVCSTQASR
jgi:hypothetical protein